MVAFHRRLSVSEHGKRALVLGAGLSLLYSAVVFAYSLAPGSNVSITGTLWHAVVLSSVLAFGTIGVPVFLWRRYRLRSPLVLLAVVLLFWHVIVYTPPFGEGDSPGFLFVSWGCHSISSRTGWSLAGSTGFVAGIARDHRQVREEGID